MNTSLIKTSLCFLLILAVFEAMADNDNTKRVADTVSQKASAGDTRGLIATLPEVELLWKDDPEAYLKSVKLAVPVLRVSSDPEARKVALETFAAVMSKGAPSDTVAAASYFALKDKIIADYCNLDEVRSNKARLLMIATFLGEVRSRRIPGYQNGGGPHPALMILYKAGVREASELPTTVLKEAYEKAVKQDKEETNMNALQLELFSADSGLMFSLKEYAKVFPAKKTENRDFYQELATRAKLTAEERKELQVQY